MPVTAEERRARRRTMPSQKKKRLRDPAKARVYNRRHYAKPGMAERKYEASLVRRFGMTLADKERMHVQQGRRCACCGKLTTSYQLVVDHDHATGKVRGLLCDWCNRGLGLFRDNPETLESAAAYLRRSRGER